jgi:hypothetical protein
LTLSELQTILAEIPQDIPVWRYCALKDSLPRVVWNETSMDQTYSSNEADDLRIRVVVELITTPETAPRFLDIIRLLRLHKIPFTCVCGYDDDNKVVSYEFTIMIDEAFPDG